ncbi:3',5'-cyclic AMP phosphodiesterase CpdA [Rhodospirillales bacterium URHD0017]|nr:3',5'-cyclic AMP phosphodiesterase CpdA [Rhodospirillales bacterium URHD0017]
MNVSSVDLLPPIFDQVVAHYSPSTSAAGLRQTIVQALHNVICDAAVAKLRADRLLPGEESASELLVMETFDRLSGPHLSRTSLTRQIADGLSLPENVVDIALLLIEAQIDLRFKSNDEFSFDDIGFRKPKRYEDGTGWCNTIVASTLRVSTQDRPTFLKRGSRPEGLRVLVESLQLSATLRVAAPYAIVIERSRIAQRLSERKELIRLLHISDLHMVEDLTDPRRGGSPTLGQKKHSFEATKRLSTAVGSLQPEFDVLVATGDLTTDGKRGSFETVLQYVQGGSISGENKMRISLFGLGAGRDRRLLLPGNHDRFEGKLIPGQRLSRLFEDTLGTTYPYPYLKAFQAPRQGDNPLTLLFFVFDSNLPAGAENASYDATVNALSQGNISEAEVEEAVRLACEARKQGQAPSFRGDLIKFDPKHSVSIALLHHHPVAKYAPKSPAAPAFPSKEWLSSAFGVDKRKEEAMKLKNADVFLEGCLAAGIQIVLFGHNHYPYQRAVQLADPPKALWAFCCPTTLEPCEHGNGFHVFDFVDGNTLSLDFYLSQADKGTPGPFTRLASRSGKFNLTKLTEAELATAYVVKKTRSWPELPELPTEPGPKPEYIPIESMSQGSRRAGAGTGR